MEMLRIVTGAPIWVWPLLGLLIWMGVRNLAERQAPVWTLAILPLVGGILAPARIVGAPGVIAGMIVYFVSAALLLWPGIRAARSIDAGFDRTAGRMTLPGSRFTLVVGLSIFFVSYAFGVLFAVRRDLAVDPVMALAPVAIGGALMGFTVGRQGFLYLRYLGNA
jgi:hypothetical protein